LHVNLPSLLTYLLCHQYDAQDFGSIAIGVVFVFDCVSDGPHVKGKTARAINTELGTDV